MKSLLVLFVLFVPACAFSQYSLTGFTVAGGGGTSTGGVYSVSSSSGQPAAGRLTGGQFNLESGFWCGITLIQTEGAPALAMGLTATNTVVLSWPKGTNTWQLEETADLGSAQWTPVGGTPNETEARTQVVLPLLEGNRFFRLRRP